MNLKQQISEEDSQTREEEISLPGKSLATPLVVVALLYSGMVQALIAPPLNWTFLHILSWVPAFWVFSKLKGRRAFLAGWLVGTSANLAIFYWLTVTAHNFLSIPMVFTPLVLLLFAAGLGLYVAVFAWGYQRICRIVPRAWPFAIAAWFCALEFLMPQIFTYYQGVAWYQKPHLFLVSSLTGVSGISFLVIAGNAIALQAIEGWNTEWKNRRALILNGSVFSLLLLLSLTYSTDRLQKIKQAETNAKQVNVALIQPNHTVERKNELRRQPPDSFARDLVALSNEVAVKTAEPIDVYVWPENALQDSPAKESNHPVIDFARSNHAEIWTGALFQDDRQAKSGTHRNAAFRVDAKGQLDTRYDKTLLIPFGEYVPFKDVVPGLDQIRLPGNFEAGDGPKFLSSNLANISFLICYEAIKSAYVRTGIKEDTEILVNVSGDARSGDHSEQSQHMMLVAMQAAQYGVPLVRATSIGISAFVDARGMITAQTRPFERGGLVQKIRPLRVPSLYAQFGDWFAWACVGASILLLTLSDRFTDSTRQKHFVKANY